ncbi:FadR/GntR family transcriptional regulator [Mycetocola miduiensis]|uniref:DNA-binding transcriptional regulator, FadR family n=1 Tax=Mycetocola miduiensis TaxID=995034 RepID=A0A1I5CEM0_9MICO|nr:FCD domain-containing protein [Mycetocola miduiensis]SFN85459.1 DNA-binding transcriptional regulator, FadR family [Mycetocola miduiensis]
MKYRSRIGSGLYERVVEILGQEIINGEIPVGGLVFADQLCERLGVSRSVVRESIRTLSSMGLVEARPQVGTRVQPSSNWDLLNPYVVKWRSQGPDYVHQMKELLELRLGIEQAAARLAAERIAPGDAAGLLETANGMKRALEKKDTRGFFDADAAFHRLLLEGTENAVIAQLADTIGAALEVRGGDTRPVMHAMSEKAVEHHVALAQALVDGDSAKAQAEALLLVEGTLKEFSNLPGE